MRTATSPRPSRAFTLIELLVVIAIIAVLITVVLAVGRRVTAGGRARLTEDAIRILDKVIDEYKANKGALPAAYVQDPVKSTVQRPAFLPIADGVALTPSSGTINSVGWFLYQTAAPQSTDSVTSVDTLLKELNPKLLRTNLVFPTTSGGSGPVEGTAKDGMPANFRTVVDAFGRDLRYVHPNLDGEIQAPDNDTWKVLGDVDSKQRFYSILKLRRSVKDKDADGGYCKSGQPYFYSAGPDGDPSTTTDNVYTSAPDFRKD